MLLKSCLRPLLSGGMLGLMLAFPQNSADAALHALEIFAASVLPSLFPFTACMLLFTAGRTVPMLILLILAYLGGSPSGARLFAGADMDAAASRRMARMTGTMSPMFFLGTLSLWLQNEHAARLLLFCHLMSAVLLCFPLRRHNKPQRISLPPLSFGEALQQSVLAMLTVGGCIVLGSVAARLIACLFPQLPRLPLSILQSLLEVTSGSKSLITLNPPLLLPLLSACTSFSGLSILLQNGAYWGKHGVSLPQLLLFALLRALLAFLLCFVILLCHSASFAL